MGLWVASVESILRFICLKALTKLELMVIDPSRRCYRNGMWANYTDPSWEEKHKSIVQEKFEKVKMSAQLKIL